MDISSMFTVYNILTIVIGAGLLYYGLKWYGTSLAISFFVPTFLMLAKFKIIEQYPAYALGGLIGVALLIFFLARPLTYFVAWLFVCGAQIGLIGAIGFNIEEIPGTIYGWIILGIGIVVVWFIRTQLRAVNIGLAGGSSIALGTSFFIFDLWTFEYRVWSFTSKTNQFFLVATTLQQHLSFLDQYQNRIFSY